MRFSLIILVASARLAMGATYYVSPTGNDSTGDGSVGNPWRTQQKAMDTMVAGDTTLVQPGIYTNSVLLTTSASGTAGSYITLKANGAVTNQYGFRSNHKYFVLDGFIFDNLQNISGMVTPLTAIRIGTNADCNIIKNCTVQNGTWNMGGIQMTPGDYFGTANSGMSNDTVIGISRPQDAAKFCVISNDIVRNVSDCQAYNIFGLSNLVINCQARDIFAGDAFFVFGAYNTFQGNYGSNIWTLKTADTGGFHPDCFQAFGDSHVDTYSNYIIGNLMVNMPPGTGPCQLEQGGAGFPAVSQVHDLFFIGNVWINCGSAGSIDFPTHWWFNTFYSCGSGSGNVLNFAFNNVWDCPAPPATDVRWKGAATNSTCFGNAFIMCGLNAAWETALSPSSSDYGWYVLVIGDGFLTNTSPNFYSDWNYIVDGTNGRPWAPKTPGVGFAKTPFYDPHGINGGNPGIIWTNNLVSVYTPYDSNTYSMTIPDVRTMKGSVMIDAASTTTTNGALSLPSFDRWGTTRVLGANIDIGAAEYDSNLVVKFDFDEGPITSRYLLDVTGNIHTGWQENSTNFLQTTTSFDDSVAALGVIVGSGPTGYSNTWYAAVTNLTTSPRLDFITNGTFMAWVQKGTNDDARWDAVVDCGYPPATAEGASGATNSWSVEYGFADFRDLSGGTTDYVFKIYGTNLLNDASHPSLLAGWPGPPKDGLTWAHIAATWVGGSNVVLYYNGAYWSSNLITSPFLRVNSTPTIPWMAVNCQTHADTPYWATGGQSLFGMNKGKVDDLRIYNRALSALEIQNIYGATTTGTSPAPTPPTPSGLSIIKGNGTMSGNGTLQ